MDTTARDIEALERGIQRLRADIRWREGQDTIPDYDLRAIHRDHRDILAYTTAIEILWRTGRPAQAAE